VVCPHVWRRRCGTAGSALLNVSSGNAVQQAADSARVECAATLEEVIANRAYVDRRGNIKIRSVINRAEDMGKGMVALHKSKTSHRDLKPANFVMYMRPDGSLGLAIIDLGLAKKVAHCGVLVVEADALGRRLFQPGEVLDFGQWTVKADIYSSGRSLLEVCTSRFVPGGEFNGLWSAGATGTCAPSRFDIVVNSEFACLQCAMHALTGFAARCTLPFTAFAAMLRSGLTAVRRACRKVLDTLLSKHAELPVVEDFIALLKLCLSPDPADRPTAEQFLAEVQRIKALLEDLEAYHPNGTLNEEKLQNAGAS
jgi:serine/threonine protein kinase